MWQFKNWCIFGDKNTKPFPKSIETSYCTPWFCLQGTLTKVIKGGGGIFENIFCENPKNIGLPYNTYVIPELNPDIYIVIWLGISVALLRNSEVIKMFQNS